MGLPHAVHFGMQIKSDHLFRHVVEIQPLKLHSLWVFVQTQNCTFYGTEGVHSESMQQITLRLNTINFYFRRASEHKKILFQINSD